MLASVFAIGSTKPHPPFLLLVLILFVWMFFYLEREQNNFTLLFGRRAIQIEREIHRVIRFSIRADENPPPPIGMVPRIAHLIIEANQRPQPKAWWARLWRWIIDPSNLLYIGQTAAILLAIIFLLYVRSKSSSTTTRNYIRSRETNYTSETEMNKLANENGTKEVA